ncbi:MAG: 50S ribosomal protein L3 N(5)-glutamine methyltransferase [Gammaproteobacteria bacterium]|nr:50S ribosomal protein L3 N(5)-glutamine methyltransferase [Gammaproteobacteria bacterium]
MDNYEEVIKELCTIGDYVRWGSSLFGDAALTFGHGTDNAMDEAFAVVRHALYLPHDIPPYMIHSRLIECERKAVVELLDRRVRSRKPLPYLIKEAWFAGLSFYVDERVLIPRSPIAELVENRFEPWVDSNNVHTILDLCTGSGCIAIAAATVFPDAKLVATDISNDALDVAAMNVTRHGVTSQVKLIASDLFENLPAFQKFDVIVTNPPYVDAADMAALALEFEHEPRLALAAGEDGLDVVRRILYDVHEYLTDRGLLIVDVGNSYKAILQQFPEVPFIWPEFDRGGHGVFVLSKRDLLDYKHHFSLSGA